MAEEQKVDEQNQDEQLIKVEKGRVIEIINKEKRGYSAIKLGYFKIKKNQTVEKIINKIS